MKVIAAFSLAEVLSERGEEDHGKERRKEALQTQNHGIIEVGKDLEDHQIQPSTQHCHHVLKCHIYTFL